MNNYMYSLKIVDATAERKLKALLTPSLINFFLKINGIFNRTVQNVVYITVMIIIPSYLGSPSIVCKN
jgi:predicted Na+-dependent transporter